MFHTGQWCLLRVITPSAIKQCGLLITISDDGGDFSWCPDTLALGHFGTDAIGLRCQSVQRTLCRSVSVTTDVTIIEIEIVFLTEHRIEAKSYFSCIPSNDLSTEALDRLLTP